MTGDAALTSEEMHARSRSIGENGVVFFFDGPIESRTTSLAGRPAGMRACVRACVSWNCGEPVWRRASFALSPSPLSHSHSLSLSLRSDLLARSVTFAHAFLPFSLVDSLRLSLSFTRPRSLSSLSLSFTDTSHHSRLSSFFARHARMSDDECRSFNVVSRNLLHSTLLPRATSRHPRAYVCTCQTRRRSRLRIRASRGREPLACFRRTGETVWKSNHRLITYSRYRTKFLTVNVTSEVKRPRGMSQHARHATLTFDSNR